MARYNLPSTQYSLPLYGSVETPPPFLWTVQVAWDGSYSGDNEALRASSLTVTRGRDYLVAPGGNGFERMQPGVAVITLDNEDRRYDPWYTLSPIYPNVSPGKFAKIFVKDTATGTSYGVMYGTVDDIQPVGKNLARLVIKDGLRWLRDNKIYSGVRANFKCSSLIYYTILGKTGYGWEAPVNAQWPFTEWENAITGEENYRPAYWWGWGVNALDAINEVADLIPSTFFHGRTGKAELKERHYVPATTEIDQSEILTDISLNTPWEVVRNHIDITAHPLKVEPAVTLWDCPTIPEILAGGTVTMEPEFQYATMFPAIGQAVNIIFTANTMSDDSGVNIWANCVLTYTPANAHRSIVFSITNNGALDGFITSINVSGTNVYYLYQEEEVTDDQTSQAAYGKRSFAQDVAWQREIIEAQGYSTFLLAKLKDPQMYPVIQLENRPAKQFGPDLTELVNLTIADRGIDQTFRIGKITHTWLRENGQAVRTMFKLEPYFDPAVDFWALGTSQLGSTTILGF